MRIIPIHRNEVRMAWPSVHAWLVQSCAAVGTSAYDLFRDLMNDPAFFLVKFEEDGASIGAAVFQVDRESVHGVAIAGELPANWADEVDAFMERLARSMAIKKLSLEGRRGWVRLIKRLGWRYEAGIMVREV